MAIRLWKGSWQADVSVGGERRRKSFPTKQAAKDYEHWAISEFRKGTYPFERPIQFKDFSKIYFERRFPGRTPHSIETDKSRMKRLIEFFGDYKLSQITPEMIEEFKSNYFDQISGASVNRHLALLSNLLNKAVAWGYLPRSPYRGINRYPEPMKRGVIIPDDKLEILKKYTSPNPNLHLLVLFGRYQGIREGEILNLKWSDIDLAHEMITIRSSKISEVRVVNLATEVFDALQSFPRNLRSEYIFFNPRTGERLKSFRTAWENALKQAGIENFRFHDLRHTFSSMQMMEGRPAEAVIKYTGHKSTRQLQRYVHFDNDYLKSMVSKSKVKNLGLKKGKK
ncbi:MAG: tyrosine-type recombinase/integrase [Candidatus Pacebacteria bacterium]|nr:tyrosine-type recombinase/integrase [Candidatus Paceibacterota bacterium]